jgi:hypothetical protein
MKLGGDRRHWSSGPFRLSGWLIFCILAGCGPHETMTPSPAIKPDAEVKGVVQPVLKM